MHEIFHILLNPETTMISKSFQAEDSSSSFSKPEGVGRNKTEGRAVSGHGNPDINESTQCDMHFTVQRLT